MPSEYYREVFGGEIADACEFGSLDEANEILGLMMRHWNTIAATLHKDEVYVPLLQAIRYGPNESVPTSKTAIELAASRLRW